MDQFIFVIVISLDYHMSPVGGAMRQQMSACVVLDRYGCFFCIFSCDGQLDDILLPAKKREKTTNSFISQVTTIYSSLLVFIHHWYIVFW